MSDNWVVQNLENALEVWNDKLSEIWQLITQSPQTFKSFRFSDINYLVASREDKESMFLTYSELLNSLDSGATTKITINNHRLNRSDFEESILMPMKQDGLDEYRKEYNDMLLDKATGANGITQEKYITITVAKKDIEEARAYFARIGADLTAHFANLGSKCVPLNAVERLRILHDFYRPGDEAAFSFDMNRKARLGHDFRDYICPDSVERTADHIKLGEKYAMWVSSKKSKTASSTPLKATPAIAAASISTRLAIMKFSATGYRTTDGKILKTAGFFTQEACCFFFD